VEGNEAGSSPVSLPDIVSRWEAAQEIEQTAKKILKELVVFG
jgi:hypothetical protein